MRTFSFSLSRLFGIGLGSICSVAFVICSAPLTANEPFLNKPSTEWTEAEALQVLNDSPWAHTITTTAQDFQCDYEHPAYPGTYTEEFAREHDSITPTPPATEVKSDGAEYVVRLLSMKPMQSAVDRLLTLDEQKWKKYGGGWALTARECPNKSAGASLQPGRRNHYFGRSEEARPPGCEFSGLCFSAHKCAGKRRKSFSALHCGKNGDRCFNLGIEWSCVG